MRLMMEKQLLLTSVLIFALTTIITHTISLFMTSLSLVIHHHILIFPPPLCVNGTLLQTQKLKMEENLHGMPQFNETEVSLIEIYSSREPFGFTIFLLCLIRRSTTVKCWVVTAMKPTLNPSLMTVDVFAVVLP